MFTGIIEEIGLISNVEKQVKSGAICIKAKTVLEGTKIGDSIAVNGVCLTVTEINGNSFYADVMAETMNRSNLKKLKAGEYVNLERAMAADGRFGGHIVSGHIDGTGIIESYKKDENAIWVTISCHESILRLIVEKGSICIDGISLTVAKVFEDSFSVSIIPHTASQTTLVMKTVGDMVNLENDIIGKYVQRLIEPQKNTPRSAITMEKLVELGF